jgi:hypothetical protein
MSQEFNTFSEENWATCLEDQLALKGVPQNENFLYRSLYRYAKGGNIFLPDREFKKVNHYTKKAIGRSISRNIRRLHKLNLIKLDLKTNPENENLRRVRFIEFNIHPKKKVIWSK